MMKRSLALAFLAVLVSLAACEKKSDTQEVAKSNERDAGTTTKTEEPQYITVQHILIGFEGSVPGKPVTRTPEEAQQMAEEILKRAQEGENFDALVQEHTDDQHPGIYSMANFDVPLDNTRQMFARKGMVRAFGDVGFTLAVGEVGLAPYDRQASPYGWHIIKRIE